MELKMVERLIYSPTLSVLDSRNRSLPKPRMSNLLLCKTIGSYSRHLFHYQHIDLNSEEVMNAA
jgi:hypothetical protein